MMPIHHMGGVEYRVFQINYGDYDEAFIYFKFTKKFCARVG